MNEIKTPGMLVRPLCIDKLGLSVAEAARHLKMTSANLYLLINGKIAITPDMALRLEAVFNTDSRKWLNLQLEHDLKKAKKELVDLQRISKKKIKVPKSMDVA